ncbi:DUF3631 domain-containing protein [Gemmatimonadota bacterium]
MTASVLGEKPPLETVREVLNQFAASVRRNSLSPSDRELLVSFAADELKEAKVTGGRQIVQAALQVSSKDNDSGQGTALALSDPDLLDEVPDGSDVADTISQLFSTHLVLPGHADTVLTLWTLHAHAFAAWSVSPILALTSPEKRCGKTTTLELLTYLTPRPLPASSITAAVVFRAVEKHSPTLLIDEADTFLRGNDQLRGMLNSAHRKSLAVSLRVAGDDYDVRSYRTWCPRVIALIGHLPDTLADRSVEIRLRRKKPGEGVSLLRLDRLGDETEPLRRAAWTWAQDNIDRLRAADPCIPTGLHDREADNWRPLLAIADLLGGEWPLRAREAATTSSEGKQESDSAREMILFDIRRLFDEHGADRMASAQIVEELARLEDRPWPEWRNGKPITVRQLARLLQPFDVRPKALWIDNKTKQGYDQHRFIDAWDRYLPPPNTQGPQDGNEDNELGEEADPKERDCPWGTNNPGKSNGQGTLGVLGDKAPEIRDYESDERAGTQEADL